MLRDVVGDDITKEMGEEFGELIEKLKILGWKEVRPWKEFFAVIKPPQMNYQHLEQRMTTNFLHYRSNYVLICIGLFAVRLILMPIVLLTLVLCISFSTFIIVIHKKPLVMGDLKIEGQKKIYLAGSVSLLLMILTGALQQIIWGMIYSIILCGLHMIMRPRSVTSKANKLYDELKVSGFSWFGGKEMPEKLKDPENPESDDSQSTGVAGSTTSVRKRAVGNISNDSPSH
mmetsp:Transcript_28250/g.28539  ORF Transcript_28250/g.28539 Transcript_28250/m.28539 type:complete len:230 (+) Transcript_28250:201-890(+)